MAFVIRQGFSRRRLAALSSLTSTGFRTCHTPTTPQQCQLLGGEKDRYQGITISLTEKYGKLPESQFASILKGKLHLSFIRKVICNE